MEKQILLLKVNLCCPRSQTTKHKSCFPFQKWQKKKHDSTSIHQILTVLHSEGPKLYGVLALLSANGLNIAMMCSAKLCKLRSDCF